MRLMLNGGLGNQLFQISAGRAISNHLDCGLTIDSRWSDLRVRNRTRELRERLQLRENEKWSSFNFFPLDAASLKLASIGRPPLIERISSAIEFSEDQTRIEYHSRSWQLAVGFFADPQIHEWLKGMKLDLKLSLPRCEIVEKSHHFAVVHVRGGDYWRLRDSFGVLGSGYYDRAIRKLDKNVELIWVTDDVEYCSKISASWRERTIKILGPKDLDVFELFSLFNQAQAAVIANSTLSWWATTMSKTVAQKIGPKDWFRSTPGAVLLGNNWEKAENDWA